MEGKATRPVGFGETYATLIRNGHSLESIRRYTSRQIRLFFKEAEELEKALRRNLVSDINAALAKPEHTNQHLKQLERSSGK